jgi:hypothetical protein
MRHIPIPFLRGLEGIAAVLAPSSDSAIARFSVASASEGIGACATGLVSGGISKGASMNTEYKTTAFTGSKKIKQVVVKCTFEGGQVDELC